MGIKTLEPAELAEKLKKPEEQRPLLLDVRREDEFRRVRLERATLIPLHLLPLRHGELPRDREIVVYCHHGVRSYQGAAFLAGQGFERVFSLSGGIDLYAAAIDPSLPRY